MLKKHINAIHNNVFNFKCKLEGCDKAFRTGYRLYVHELAHVNRIITFQYRKESNLIYVHTVNEALLRKERLKCIYGHIRPCAIIIASIVLTDAKQKVI